MSKIRLDLIWEENKVLPYIKSLVNDLGYVSEVHLVGSRRKDIKIEDGKDWDFIFITPFKIVNTKYWGRDQGYHVDIIANTKDSFSKLFELNKIVKIWDKNDKK